MKRGKAQSGFTLAELIVTMALLTILTAGLVGAMYTARQNYMTSMEKQDYDYNIRNALVYITREIHADTYVMEPVPPDYNKLVLLRYAERGARDEGLIVKRIEYYLDADGFLRRDVYLIDAGGVLRIAGDSDYDVPFAAKKLALESFTAKPGIDRNGNEDGRRVSLSVTGKGGGPVFKTSVAFLRTQGA